MENKIRNVALLGHMSSGKTTLVEALASECMLSLIHISEPTRH